MKHAATIMILTLILLVSSAQPNTKVHHSQATNILSEQELHLLVDAMGNRQVVGLGEGTHGTKEFNTLRIAIIKELIEKKGFTVLCFENSFGDSYYLNTAINSNENIEAAMKKYLLKLWQTPELRDLLYWIRDYNKKQKKQVKFVGMDFNYVGNTALIITNYLKGKAHNAMSNIAQTFYETASYSDYVWDNRNRKRFKYNNADFRLKLRQSYQQLRTIDSFTKANNLNRSKDFERSINNYKMHVARNRDSNMAEMVISYANDEKVIVWAHAVHLALKSPLSNGNTGSEGGYIKNKIPTYYALGTGTEIGTYAGTEERFNTRNNKMEPYQLPKLKIDSWDKYFANLNKNIIILNRETHKEKELKLSLRLIGYGPPQRIIYSENLNITDLFDSYIFIKETSAATYIE